MATLQVEAPEKSQNVLGSITINAPLEKVFNAHTNLDLFKKWCGRGNDLNVISYEPKSGGNWHVIEKSDEGEYEFCGSFHEISPNERIVWTFEFMGLPERGHVALEKMEFEAADENTTRIKTVSTYQSIEDRDGMVASGMEEGWRQSIEALEEVASQS